MATKPGRKSATFRPCGVCRWQRWAHSLKIDGVAKAVLRVLIQHSDYKTGAGYPALPTIANESGFSKSTAVDALKRLEHKYGVIAVSHSKGGWGCSSIYSLKNCPAGVPFKPVDKPNKTVRDADGLEKKLSGCRKKLSGCRFKTVREPDTIYLLNILLNKTRACAREKTKIFF